MINKLELNWIGKYDNEINPEPRILIENKKYSYKAESQGQLELSEETEPTYDNILIHGDNLLALKSLEMEYAGKIKCIYIDPPYNTGSAFEHYDDNLEHSIWLNLMKPRLEILRNLLSDDGFIFIQIDNNEMAYLKILCDEVFGRDNFVNDIVWKRRGGSANPKNRLNNVSDYILWYSKSQNYTINHIFSLEDENTKQYIKQRFNNIDENGRKFMKSPLQSPNYRENLIYEYKGYKSPKKGWSISREMMEEWDKAGKLCFPENKNQNINRKVYLDEYKGQPISNLWTDIKVINPMAIERLDFDGQKPEALIERIIMLSTQKGDLVLDSFLGSGTTAAVAHKMGRKWIGIELGDHAYTHCYERLKAVIDGEQGGISKAVNWKGGGGFKFYELAPSVFQKTPFGNMVISEKYNADMLAAALARHEGYTYCPDEKVFWKQGYSGEKNFIFTTTEYITKEYLEYISGELAEDEYILIYSTQFDETCSELYKNIIVKQIPKSLLGRCEYDKDNYNLNIIEQETDWEEDDE